MNEDKASRYHRLKRRSSVLLVAVSALFLLMALFSGLSAALDVVASAAAGGNRVLRIGLVTLVLFAAHEALTLPVAVYTGFVLERRYGLSSQSWRSWFSNRAKGIVVEITLATGAALVVYLAIPAWPRAWWVFSTLVFSGATAVFAGLAPVTLFPLFYRLTPLERESLRARVVALSTKAGVRILDVYEWGLGDKTRRANAAVIGTGATRRILLSDTLLSDYSEDEIEVILAHEIAHHVHRDLLTSLAVDSAVLATGLAVAAAVLSLTWSGLGLESPADVAGLPLLPLVIGGTMVAAAPVMNALSRRHERRADRYALELTHRPAAFVSAMRRMAAQNLAEEQPSRLTLWLFHTHPPFEERIQAARAYGN